MNLVDRPTESCSTAVIHLFFLIIIYLFIFLYASYMFEFIFALAFAFSTTLLLVSFDIKFGRPNNEIGILGQCYSGFAPGPSLLVIVKSIIDIEHSVFVMRTLFRHGQQQSSF